MSSSVTFTPDLHRRIAERSHPNESFIETVFRAVDTWLDLGDARTEQGAAFAVLLDEIGAAARGEMSVPQPAQLSEWLGLLNQIAV